LNTQTYRRSVLKAAAGGLVASAAAIASQSAKAESLPNIPAGRTHVLESTKDTVSMGVLDPARGPAVTIDSGDIVHYPNTWTVWGNEAKYGLSFDEREPIRKRYPSGPYSNVGPVAIRDAEPGDVLEVRWLKLRPIDWGWNSFPLGVGALPHDFDKPYVHYFRFDKERRSAKFVDGVTIPLTPFQDIAALQPKDDKPVSGILAGPYGGNLALPEMVVGTSLLLPVQRSGGLFWTSASVAAQGDGVVDQTGIETAMEDMRVQFVLHKNVPLDGPMVETPTHWIGFGFADSLDNALVACLRGMIKWISRIAKMDPRDVYPLCSMAASFRVTQFSDQTGSVYTSVPPRAVHCMLPKGVFSPSLRTAMAKAARSA
jgi:acetamidase/formamidase